MVNKRLHFIISLIFPALSFPHTLNAHTIPPAPGNIERPQTFNRYAYGLNNPYKYVDPDGEQAIDIQRNIELRNRIRGTLDFLPATVLDFAVPNDAGPISNELLFGPQGFAGNVIRNAGKVGQTVSKLPGKGDKFQTRITRQGDKAVRIIRKDGSVIDISPKRVKEFTLSTHPNAPSGTLQRTKFEDALPGSKGFKRAPTQEELGLLEELTK